MDGSSQLPSDLCTTPSGRSCLPMIGNAFGPHFFRAIEHRLVVRLKNLLSAKRSATRSSVTREGHWRLNISRPINSILHQTLAMRVACLYATVKVVKTQQRKKRCLINSHSARLRNNAYYTVGLARFFFSGIGKVNACVTATVVRGLKLLFYPSR